MNKRVNDQTAKDVVGESLGLSMDDLGANNNEEAFITDTDDEPGDEGDDEGDNIQPQRRQQPEGDGDDDLDSDFQQPQHQQRQPDNKRQQQQPDQRRRPDDLSVTHTPKLKMDAKGNVLGQDGKIVATAGREARYYTSLHKSRSDQQALQETARTAIASFKTRLTKAIEIGTNVANELSALKQQGSAAQRAGLNDQEFNGAIELASMYQRDKVGAIKLMLTRAAASGIDLTTLGLQPGGFDPKSLMDLVRAEISKVVAPVNQLNQRDQTEQQRLAREEEAKTAATEQLNQFLLDNPEARAFLPVIQKIYEVPEYQSMSLNEVWLQIQLNQLKRGRAGDMPQSRRELRSQNQNRRQPRIPDGRNHLNGDGTGRQRENQGNDEMASLDMSYNDIVKDVLKQLG